MTLGLDTLFGKPPSTPDEPVTARVVRLDGGAWVAVLDGDQRVPIGPCRGPAGLEVGDVVLVLFTNERPWIAAVDQMGES